MENCICKGEKIELKETDFYIKENMLIVDSWCVEGCGCNTSSLEINYCPMCGRKLEVKKNDNSKSR